MCCSRVVFQEIKHDIVHWVISLPRFTFVSAAVSELRESNQNKKEKKEKKNNSEIGYRTV